MEVTGDYQYTMNKNVIQKAIPLIGLIDLITICLVSYSSFMKGEIPFITSLISDLESGMSFGINSLFILGMLGHLVFITILLSGPLQLYSKRLGVIISLTQVPFRFILVVPPTFYFLGSMFGDYKVMSIVFMFALEVLKVVIQIKWLKDQPFSGR